MFKGKVLAAVFILIILLISIAGIGLILFYGGGEEVECAEDLDCVPSACCHATSCVPFSEKPDCSGAFCSQECAPGSLDCGKGSCLCFRGKCVAEFNG